MSAAPIHDVELVVQEAFAKNRIHDLRQVHVEHRDKQLVLSGSVSRFYYKQLAQETARSICRDIELINSIRVR